MKKHKRSVLLFSLLLSTLSWNCKNDLPWIRKLPSEFGQTASTYPNLLLGLYERPTEKKSPMNSKDFHSDWVEWIQIENENQFYKEWRSTSLLKEKIKFIRTIGKGKYKQEGPWVLFHTESIQRFECEENLSFTNQVWKKKSHPLCANESPISASYDLPHKLLYHFDKEERSIAPLQYESGYLESSFGIGWESGKPYEEGILFKKAKSKYVKKEFQPHVYYYGRLD